MASSTGSCRLAESQSDRSKPRDRTNGSFKRLVSRKTQLGAYLGQIDLVQVPADHVDEVDHEGQFHSDQDGEQVGRRLVPDTGGLIIAKVNTDHSIEIFW